MNKKREGAADRFVLLATPAGWLGLAAGASGLVEVTFHPDPEQVRCQVVRSHPLALEEADVLLERAIGQLEGYFAGTLRSFDLPLDFGNLTPFALRVLRVLSQVPYGQVLSYGELAARAGSPRAARAVGGVMARNPFPIIIPCHRVVGAGDKMVGYSGGAGVASKMWLLRFEQEVLGGG